jgi:hypothetical protein
MNHKRILGICKDRFSRERDSIGTGNENARALTFDKEMVEKVGKTFEIISEIKIIQTDEDETDGDDVGEWKVPFPSQDLPTEHTQNHAPKRMLGRWGEHIVILAR